MKHSHRFFLAFKTTKKGTHMLDPKIMFDPEKYGYKICTHCNGYGSSLKEEYDTCTRCFGSGLVKKVKDADLRDDRDRDHK